MRTQIGYGAERLASASREPRLDAFLLLARTLGKDRAWMLAHPDASLTAEQLEQYNTLLERRAQHEPIQYILGAQEFFGLHLRVTPAVLIPRPETEHLVEAVLERAPRDRALRIVDIGTGSGAIAIALAHALPLAQVDALDLSEAALAVARENAATHGVAERVRLLHSDLLGAVHGECYDFVVSNPPYIAESEVLEPQVADFEPHLALFAGSDGLAAYRRIFAQASGFLHRNGWLALELGHGQAAAVDALFAAEPGWGARCFVDDLQNIARVALAQWHPRDEHVRGC